MLSIFAADRFEIGRNCHVNSLDRKILAALENNGRLTVTELAEQVGLSLSPCHRRVRALEESGVIRGYRAELDPVALGLDFSSLVFVTLKDSKSVPAFEDAVARLDNVVQAQRLFGDPDYLLQVVVRDLPAYQRLYDEHLTRLPGVLRMTSTLVMKHVVTNRPLTSAME
ncbi:transcriptional regulator, AsnC family [Comamonas testosteroni KF-1]|uniref:Transcriptional regulator, AsnC family n=1 Tax=Comamonas testosteroni (strain DSM 14576 / KF-1) TaxID=399795 RepID=B7WZ86_COMTK|nr:transcriptional regulator, AsnC family [Comamonas testosteroni KF-1]